MSVAYLDDKEFNKITQKEKIFFFLIPLADTSGLSLLDPALYYVEPDYETKDLINFVNKDNQKNIIKTVVVGSQFRPYTELLSMLHDDGRDYIVYKKNLNCNYGDNPWTWCYFCQILEDEEPAQSIIQ